jgi:DNA-binding transcriptional regulator GbsR (MarR family)
VINYKAPFYDFFQNHYLKKLDLKELIEILYKLSEITQIKISINTENKTYLQSLFQLTGGNPRTVVMLLRLLVKGFSKSIVDDLEALLDESTPLNKARFEELPAQQQIILNAIAQNWDPINLSELSEETRYGNAQLSPQLNRLIAAGWIETTKADKREWADKTRKSKERAKKGNAYSISERFLSIWLIMRNGRRKRRNDIRKVLKSYEWIYGKQNSRKDAEMQQEKLSAISDIYMETGNYKDAYCLEQTLFALQNRNEGIAGAHLSEALAEIEDKLNPKTQDKWEYFAAIAIKLGYAQWLLDILSGKGFDVIISPFFVAIQALEIERIDKAETAEIYLKNQAIEKSEPARFLMENMRRYM